MINANIKQVHEKFGAYQAHINTKFKHTSERYVCGQYRSIRKEKNSSIAKSIQKRCTE